MHINTNITRCAVFAAFAALSVCAKGQESTKAPWDDYKKQISYAENIHALGTDDAFGDSLDYYTGAFSIKQPDLNLNSKIGPVGVTRKYQAEDRLGDTDGSVFADWDIDIPNISGTFLAGVWSGNRCDDVSQSVPLGVGYSQVIFWGGNYADMPGGGVLMRIAKGYSASSSLNAKYITQGGVLFSCLDKIRNSDGQGFQAIDRNGTRYVFDQMATFGTSTVAITEYTSELGVDPDPLDGDIEEDVRVFTRKRLALYVSKIEDINGNWIKYRYDNASGKRIKPIEITTSDGVQISINYNSDGFVSSIGQAGRFWRYSYTGMHGKTLQRVDNPDGTFWFFDLGKISSFNIQGTYDDQRYCTFPAAEISAGISKDVTGTIQHPSGAIAEFTVGVDLRGRRDVPLVCRNYYPKAQNGNHKDNDYPATLYNWPVVTLMSRKVSGPGLSAMKWVYDAQSGGSYRFPPGESEPICRNPECMDPICLDDSCASSWPMIVTNPDGSSDEYWYGNTYRYNEGKLTSLIKKDSAGRVLSEVKYNYNYTASRANYPKEIGIYPYNWTGEAFMSESIRPLVSTEIQQSGSKHTWLVEDDCAGKWCMDTYARPTKTWSGSNSKPSLIRSVSYFDKPDLWIMDRVSKEVVSGTSASGHVVNNVEVSRTTFDSLARPTHSYAFGKLEQALTYNADGTVATVKDGNGNLTKLASWKRGIPQSITYADGRIEKAVVNDHGWITSRTDENGFATSYSYDAMGRLASVAQPVGDSVNWQTTTYTFERRPSAEHGLPGGHWLRRRNTGNHRTNTFLDALWRPVLVHEYDAAEVDKSLRAVKTAYDHEGRVVFTSYPANTRVPGVSGIWTEYDALGRTTSVSQDSEHGLLTTTTQYLGNAQGPYTQVTDPNGGVTRTWYQMFDTPSYESPVRIEQPEGVVTEIKRDVFGKPLEINRK